MSLADSFVRCKTASSLIAGGSKSLSFALRATAAIPAPSAAFHSSGVGELGQAAP